MAMLRPWHVALLAPQCEKGSPGASKKMNFFAVAGSAFAGVFAARNGPVEPDLGIRPVTVRGGTGQAQSLRGFFHRQTRKIAQLDELGFDGVFLGELREGFVKSEEIVVRRRDRGNHIL